MESIPEYYDQYLGPLLVEGYAADLARRVSVPRGGAVLEIAAGTGVATRLLRKSLHKDVRLVVTDLSAPLLQIARTKFRSRTNIEFQVADVNQLAFANASFDAVVCQFSLMFFPDKSAVVQEAARVLKPGGTFIFSLWDSYEHNDLVRTIHDTLINLFPKNPPSFFDTPYGYYQLDEVKTLLANTGFGEMEISILPRLSQAETPRQVALGYILGTPVCSEIAERGGLGVDEVVNLVEQVIGDTYGQTSAHAKMQALIFKAHRNVQTEMQQADGDTS